MEELKVLENVDVAEVAETVTEVVNSSDNKIVKFVAGAVGVGLALGTAIGIGVSKKKKTDKPKKLSWLDKKQIKNLEKKGIKVDVPEMEAESKSEPVEETK